MKVIRKRVSRKQRLKQPDEFLSLSERVLQYVQLHTRQIGLAAGAVLLGLMAAGGWWWLQLRWDRAAAAVYAEGYAAYHDPEASLLASSEQRVRHYQRAVEAFERVLREYPRSRVAPAALYYLGNAYAEMDRLDEAVSAYQRFLADYPRDETLRPLVMLRLGYAHLKRKDYLKAEKFFAELLELPGIGRDLPLYELAQLHLRRGDTDKAREFLRRLLEETPGSPWALEAQARLEVLQKPSDAENPREGPQPGQP